MPRAYTGARTRVMNSHRHGVHLPMNCTSEAVALSGVAYLIAAVVNKVHVDNLVPPYHHRMEKPSTASHVADDRAFIEAMQCAAVCAALLPLPAPKETGNVDDAWVTSRVACANACAEKYLLDASPAAHHSPVCPCVGKQPTR